MAYSTDHDALIGGRMQSDMEHLGEAAGVAAAMASRLKVSPRQIPVKQLQTRLVSLGVLREKDVPGITIKNPPSLDVLHRQDKWRAEREMVFPPEKEGKRLAVKDAIKLLGSEKALDAMVDIYLEGDKAASRLRPLLKSQNRQVYEEAAVLLGLLGDRSAVPALMEFLKERNTRRFEFTLDQATSRPSVPLYWVSIILLGRFEEKAAVPDMLAVLNSPPPPEELSKAQRAAYGDDMFKDVSTCPPPLASFTIVALGRIGDPIAVESIKPFLSVSNQTEVIRENRDFEITWGIRTNAAMALARMGDNSGVPVLVEMLDADQALVRNYAQQLLESITGKQYGRGEAVIQGN
jgi:HEAT repeat protein